eukprot:TRINITY_DN4134_c0_g6_i1.p1 TRINITY_DN4134_c0_g6~~TRINITY_DN4134_c0_g6_i1.p1  ORF type:complete len:439 (+),score=77.90 TRINITY_DN4134_c0_g6_i1:78-1319(+)
MADIFLGMDESEPVMKDLFVALKIGDTQKFSKASAGKMYKFTEKSVGERRFGKLEIYKRVGVHSVAIAPELVKGAAEFSVSVSDLSSDQLKFYMEVNPGEGVEAKKPPPEGYKNTAERAQEVKDYLEKHQLEMRLSEAMQCALREKPADPGAFIAEKLSSRVGMITPVPSRPPTAAQDPAKEQGGLGATEPPAANAAGGTSALSRQDIRANASKAITGAYEDGRLAAALKNAKAGSKPSAAAQDPAKDQGGLGATETPAAVPSGGTSGPSRKDIRADASKAITGAYEDGRLEAALKNAKSGSKPSAAAQDPAKDQGGLGATETPAAVPSGGTSGPSRKDIRADASKAITGAYEDGRLAAALKNAKTSSQAQASPPTDTPAGADTANQAATTNQSETESAAVAAAGAAADGASP